MKTEILRADHPVALQHAVDILNNGGLVSFPTDTVYGLASLAFRSDYIERLFVVKGRDSARAIAILISESEVMKKVSAQPGEMSWRLARKFWPGPLTLILKRHPNLPEILSPNQTIGIRMPDHPVALDLLSITGPLAVTSANISGHENTQTAQQVFDQLHDRIHLILDGGSSPGGVPSTVVDCTGLEPIILREGPISLESVRSALEEE